MLKTSIYAIVLISTSLIAQSTGNNNGNTNIISQIIQTYKLEHLSDEDKNKIMKLITDIMVQSIDFTNNEIEKSKQKRANDFQLSNSAEMYLENEGYKKVHIATKYANGNILTIVTYRSFSYVSKNVYRSPSDGYYYAKTSISGGISEYINSMGTVVRVMAYDWEPF